MMQKEYGGYLSIEKGDKEYYSNNGQYEVTRFNAARYAIVQAFKDGGFCKLYVPCYICPSVIVALEESEIVYEMYNIDENFEPDLKELGLDEAILITGYYGVFSHSFFEKLAHRYKNIIFDHTQSFYSDPIIKTNVYNIYSPRKFFCVSDGAYLVSKDYHLKQIYRKDYSASRLLHIFEAVENGTNACYKSFLEAEEELSKNGVMEMSDVTQFVLSNLDYERIKIKRRSNFLVAHNILKDINEMHEICSDVEIDNQIVPMVYPCLVKENGSEIRSRLVENHIYVSQWWKAVIDLDCSSVFEKHISENLIPVPIDQRYDNVDIEDVCRQLLNIISTL